MTGLIERFLRKRGWVTRREMDYAVAVATAKATTFTKETEILATQTRESIAAYRSLELAVHKERTRWLAGDVDGWLAVNEHAIHLAEVFLGFFDDDLPNLSHETLSGNTFHAAGDLREFLKRRKEIDDFEVQLKLPQVPK